MTQSLCHTVINHNSNQLLCYVIFHLHACGKQLTFRKSVSDSEALDLCTDVCLFSMAAGQCSVHASKEVARGLVF
jgi:hypothetical protein